MRYRSLLLLVLCLVSLAAFAAEPQSVLPSPIPIPQAAQASAHFDPEAATNAYLALMPPAAKARSDAYFEGGYWLILWEFLWGAAISIALLAFGWSIRMRERAERMSSRPWLQTILYLLQYFAVLGVAGFPLTLYESFFREHQYGLSTQTFAAWMGDLSLDFALDVVMGAIVGSVLYAIVRKLSRTWWIWGAITTSAFVVLLQLIWPVFLSPLFNKRVPLHDPKVTEPILRMARANGISARDVYEIDASKQTTRMSANVSGFGSTMRITINDNLLRRGSPEEIQAFMGHEIGHYVLNHSYDRAFKFTILIAMWFVALRLTLGWALARWGTRQGLRGISDTAALPLVVLLSSLFFFVLTPVINTIIRTQEAEADMYGLNAAHEPDGFAQAALHLGEYRKMSPGPVEEFLFFDHPSGRARILAAMRWKEGERASRPQSTAVSAGDQKK